MSSKRPKPLFKVASEFNVSTQTIVDTLNDNGFDVANRPNFKVTPEMYSALDGIYGEDKAKSADHEKAREEYESRRNQMMNQRNDSVTLDNVLEPIEDSVGLEPEDEPADLQPEEDALDLEPLEPEEIEEEGEAADEEVEAEPEASKETPEPEKEEAAAKEEPASAKKEKEESESVPEAKKEKKS